MRIKQKYLNKYLHDIATLQIADEYRAKGYTVSLEEKIGEYRADIIARKNEEVIIIEVKAGKLTAERKHIIAKLSDYVRKQGNYKFLVVFVNTPQEKQLEIEGFEELLTYYIHHNLPDKLDALSSNTRFDGLQYIILDEIKIQGLEIHVKGNGVINVALEYGSRYEDFLSIEDNYPFHFDVVLKHTKEQKLEIGKVNHLEVDVSDFYE